MGLGKTVMMLSLIHSNKKKGHNYIANIKESKEDTEETNTEILGLSGKKPAPANKPSIKSSFFNNNLLKDSGTLIILPVTLLA